MKNYKKVNIFDINTLKQHAYFEKENVLSLNGTWKFKLIKDLNNSHDYREISHWDSIIVPMEWQLVKDSQPIYTNFNYPEAIDIKNIGNIDDTYNEVGIYCKTFDYQKNTIENIIYFGGVNSSFDLYVNNKFVGYSESSFTPSEFNLNDFLDNGKNTIVVKVYRYCTGSLLEDQDMWRLSGIFRDVYIYQRQKNRIVDFTLQSVHEKNIESASFNAELISNGNGIARVTLYDGDNVLFTEEKIIENNKIIFKSDILKVNLWSAESPYLYNVKIYYNGETICHDFGFREIKIDSSVFYLNRQPIKIKGVNRHEFNPSVAHSLTKEMIEKDVRSIKEHNINAIRTSHYPNQEYFYKMCNKYGIYVMDENNLETHGLRNKIPRNENLFINHCVDRINRMVNRDKNETSVIFWSLGNESGFGSFMKLMKEEVLSIDTTRPIHYEGDTLLEVSDFHSDMYTSPSYMKSMLNNKTIVRHKYMKPYIFGKRIKSKVYNQKPYILCEYLHGLGNAHGNVKDYWDTIYGNNRFTGGFIWDYMDQVLELDNKYYYGGDFGEKKHDGYFTNNGLLNCFGEYKPGINQIMFNYSNVQVTQTSRTEFKIFNRNYFINLKDYEINYFIERKGKKLSENILHVDIESQKNKIVKIKYKNINDPFTYITFVFKRNNIIENTTQFQLNEANEKYDISPSLVNNILDFKDFYHLIELTSKDLVIRIDKRNGALVYMTLNNQKNIIKNSFNVAFDRSDTLVDEVDVKFSEMLQKMSISKKVRRYEAFYKTHNIKLKSYKIEKDSNCISLKCKLKCNKESVELIYTITNKNDLNICYSITPKSEISRIGYRGELNGNLKKIEYFGKGNYETMRDRQDGACYGLYKFSPEDLAFQYTVPQENSNRSDISYLKLLGDNNLIITPINETLNFSAIPYSKESLDSCTHSQELEADNFTTLTLDSFQKGVGGDNPGTLNAIRKENNIQKHKKYIFECCFKLRKNLV